MNGKVFALDDNKEPQQEMDSTQNAMRNSQYGAFVKTQIVKDEIAVERKKADPNYNVDANVQEIEEEAERRIMDKSIGIPSAGNTRHWNNQFFILDWQLKHRLSIRKLLVFLYSFFFSFFFFFFFGRWLNILFFFD